jgi:protease I
MELSGLNVLIILGPDFEDREVVYPYYRFLEAGASVKLAGIGERSYKGKYGIPLDVDGQCEDFQAQKFDIVVIPGGWAPDKIRANEAALQIVRQTDKEGRIVAAICHAGWVLTSADIVRGRTVTSFQNIKDDLIHAGAKWVDQEVVVDKNLVTSRKPADLPSFCREIIKLSSKAKVGVNP